MMAMAMVAKTKTRTKLKLRVQQRLGAWLRSVHCPPGTNRTERMACGTVAAGVIIASASAVLRPKGAPPTASPAPFADAA